MKMHDLVFLRIQAASLCIRSNFIDFYILPFTHLNGEELKVFR